MEKRTLRLKLPYGHLGWQPLKPLGSEVTHPPWPPSVHLTNHHYHLHNTVLTQPSVHYTTNTTTYYIHHTHTTTFTYNNNPLHTITWSCRHTCRSHAVSCRLMQIPCRLSSRYMYSLPLSSLILLDITHLIQGSELFLPIFPHFTPPFVDRLCIHMT